MAAIFLALLSLAGQASASQVDFSANVTAGYSPLTVQFTDLSTGFTGDTSWLWDFGDGTTSTLENPVHTYDLNNVTTTGAFKVFDVTLYVYASSGNGQFTNSSFMAVWWGAFFTMNKTSGMAPTTVQFTDTSPTTPTSWAWDFDNDGVIDNTSRNPVYTFASAGTYKVNLTVTGADGRIYSRNTTFTASAYNPNCDLTWGTLLAPYAGNVYIDMWNPLRVSVKNSASYGRSAPAKVMVNSTDGFTANVSIPALEPGASYTAMVNDTTVLHTGDPAVKYNLWIDPDQSTNDVNRANNIRMGTTSYAPIYDGYAGKRYMDGGSDVDTVRTYNLRGNITSSFGDSIYQSGSFGGSGWNSYLVNWTPDDLSLPSGARVVDAWLYIPYCWDNNYVAPDNVTVTFNNVTVPYVHWYHDQSNSGGYANFVYGLMTYNVTSLFVNGTTNQASFTRHSDSSAKISTAGFSLVVVYADPNATRKQIFVNEEFDALGASLTDNAYGTNETEATAYVPFTGMTIDAAKASHAYLTTFVPWGAGTGPEGNLYVNGNQIGYHIWSYGARAQGGSDSPQVAVDTRDVLQYLNSTGNVAAVQSSAGDATPLMVAAQDFLAVEYPDVAPVASFTANLTSGSAPLTVQFTDTSSNDPGTWAWDFGDGGTSTLQNPVHTYVAGGNYTVTLTAGNPGGSSTLAKAGFVNCSNGFVISLAPGWNLVSVPLSGSGLHASDLVGNASLGVDMVASYSPSSGYLSYYPGAMSGANFALAPDVGYFVRSDRSSSFSVSGQPVAAHNVSIGYGWNLIGWSGSAITRAGDILSRVNVSMVASYGPSSGYLSYYPGAMSGANFVLAAGSGYFVESKNVSVQQLYVG